MTINVETRDSSETQVDQPVDVDIISAGQLLQNERVRCELTIKQVSADLNLKQSVINNIEQGIADKHITPIFMRGYIRSYARYLKLCEDEIIRIYDCENGDCDNQTELQSFSRRTKKEANDNRLMLASYGIAAFMIVAFLFWGLQRSDVDVVVPDAVVEVEESSSAESGTAAIKAVDSIVSELEQDLIDNAAAATNATDINAVDSQTANIAPPVEIDLSDIVAADIGTEAHTETITEPETIAPETIEVADIVEIPVIKEVVELIFDGDCWVEVRDSNGDIVISGVKKEGQTVHVEAEFPISVKLGAPEFVRMRAADKDVDLSIYRPSRLAKFTVPR